MFDQTAISTLVDSLVAIGTLALAVLTVYQLRLFIRERKANQARELADRIYTPLRVEVASWINPEQVFNDASCKTWTDLKERMPYLTLRLPRDLVGLLDTTQQLLNRIGFLNIQVREMIQDEMHRLSAELCTRSGVNYRGLGVIRILGKRELITQVDLGRVWCMKTTVKEWVENYVQTHYPVKEWELEILNGADRVGGLKEAEEIAQQVFTSLKNQPFASELREKIYKVKELAQKAISRIDEELSKPVAPWE